MRFRFKGQTFEILFKKRIIPVYFSKIIREFNNEPNCAQKTSPSNKLGNEVTLITGGYKGIGLAIARRLLSEGAKVIITGRNSQELLKVCQNIGGGNLKYCVWDISDTSIVETKFVEAEQLFGNITILINNAGVTTNTSYRVPFESIDENNLTYVQNINVIGTREMCLTFYKRYKKGTILNILSNTSIIPAKDTYFMSKWAIRSFTEAFAKELAHEQSNITINGISPGPVKTDMTFGKKSTLFRKEIPIHRIGLPEEIAELAFMQIYNALEFGSNGNIIVSDGGETLY